MAKAHSDIAKFTEMLEAEPFPPLNEADEVTFALYSEKATPEYIPKETSMVNQNGSVLA